MNNKIKDLITILIIQLVLTLPFYTANVYGLTISNVRVTKVSSNSATIEWSTDEISDGRVRYGQTTALGFTQRHDNFISNHTITVFNGINSDTPYFFAVESTDLSGNTAIDNKSSSFYTFKTTDITPPPQVNGLNLASTTPNSIFLSWNNVNIADFNHYIIYRNRVPVASSIANSFNDTNLQSNTNFNYKVSAADNSGNEGPQSDTLIASTSAIDSAAPVISNLEALPLTDAAARVTWLTNENSTTTVLYGVNKTDKIKSSDDLVANHTIVIDSLVKGAKHVIVAKSCDASNNCANLSLQSFVAGKEFNLAFINISIPRYVNRRVIDLVGSAKQFSSITLFVNNMNIPKRSLSSAEIDASGRVIFSNIQLEQDNIIRVDVVDKFGTKYQKLFDVSVDTEDPTIQLNDMPSLTSKTELAISGTTNEPGKINVFVDANIKEITTPSKITGLNTTKIGQNSVELKWDESKDKDFSHYVVYRENAGPIALTKPANFNLYIDALVDSGKSYTYQVSAVNIFGKEGEKSEPVTAATLQGGAILNLQTPEVDVFEDFRKPLLIVNVSSPFTFSIKLNKGDGIYLIKMIFEDRAGNSVVAERSVTLDTKSPDVKITSPPSGAFIFENVANEIDITGKTKPNARVHLFVDRNPFSFFNQSFEISGLPNEARLPSAVLDIPKDQLERIPEPQLDAKCRSSVSASFCRTGADFSVDADAQGDFKFEKVDLTVIFGGASRFREVPVTDFRDTQLNPEGQESKSTTLVVIATDQAGMRGVATQQIRLGTCWSGNQSWDIIPLTHFQYPTSLSTERLAEGTETIYFYLNYSYVGPGKGSKIQSVSISKACGTRELLDPRFNISCQIMSGSNTPQLRNPPENTLSYSAIQLQRLPGMDRFLENDWKDFFKALNKELTFPLKITIRYQHDKDDDGILESETQTTCEQVSYTIDNSIIDPRKVLPDWLLFDAVDFLQSSIKTLNNVQEQVNKLLEYIVVGCVVSFGMVFFVGAYRRVVAFTDEKIYASIKRTDLGKLTEIFSKNPLKTSSADDNNEQDYCKELINKVIISKNEFKLKYITDADLKKCFPNSDAAWQAEYNVYKLMRYSCDRVYGHSSPAGWTESKEDSEILTKLSSPNTCAVDQSERGQPLRIEDCNAVVKQFPGLSVRIEPDDRCFRLTTRQGVSTFTDFYKLGEPLGVNELYQIIALTERPGRIEIKFAKKINENNYLTASGDSCEQLCGVKQTPQENQVVLDKDPVVFQLEEKKKDVKSGEKKPEPKKTGVGCFTVDKCRSLNANKKIFVDNKEIPVEYAYSIGYSSKISDSIQQPCFYDGTNPKVVSNSPAERQECCCINTKGEVLTHYYKHDDIDPITEKPVHESKKADGTATGLTQEIVKPDSYADMKWSYRYSKEKFEAINPSDKSVKRYEYNPNRYTYDRDFPACFGQDSWWDGKNVVVVNPLRDHLSSLQCVNVGGISARLQFIRNLMSHFSSCLIQVRTTGRGDSATCRELFTQYVCSGLWQVIRAIVDGCSPLNFDFFKTVQDADILDYLRNGIKSAYDSTSDLQNTITSEYKNARLNELMGMGEESIARKICLAAFGYDFELDFKSFVDAAYTTPFATLVQAVTRSREFLTIEPGALKPKYEYRASWLINPGCDFERYDVQLYCVGRKQLDQYPNSVSCGSLGAPSIAYTGALPGTRSAGFSQCDCINLPDGKPGPIVFSGRLKQNVLADASIPSGQRIVTSDVRYDHLKFVLRTDRKITPSIKPNCFPTGYDNGEFYFPLIDKTARDLLDCQADLTQGLFLCKGGQIPGSKKGTASFIDLKINGVDYLRTNELVFNIGDPLDVTTTIRNVGSDKCLKVSLDGENQAEIIEEGIKQFQLPLRKRLTIGVLEDIQATQGVTIEKLDLRNTKDVSIALRFYDLNGNDIIDFENDLIDVDNNRVKGSEILNQNKILGSGNNKVELAVKDGRLIIKKEEAEIALIAVDIIRGSDGKPSKIKISEVNNADGVSNAFASIRIKSPLQTAQSTDQSQTKTVVIGLYHIKEGMDSAGGNIANCDFNNFVYSDGNAKQERPVRFRVEKKATVSSLQGAIISDPVYKQRKDEIKQSDGVELSVRVIGNDKNSDVRMECEAPAANNLIYKGTVNGDNYVFNVPPSEVSFAGKYRCRITAASSNTKAEPGKKDTEFEVLCGGKDNKYGRCDNDGICKSGADAILDGTPCSTLSSST